jgi:UDP-glucose 4-epimerase|tara:strand:+ start:1588 stop:2466 length:879 start_codon:yes stop_codon:yes gene_type:complete
MKKRKILVLGGAGFLGSHVADELSHINYDVTIFDKNKPKFPNDKHNYLISDINNKSNLAKAIKNSHAVFYFADMADITESRIEYIKTINQNIIQLVEILEICKKSKIKHFIYASSLYVYSESGSFYRASKQCAEILIKEFSKVSKFDYKLLRYGSLYGERAQKWNGIQKFIDQIISKGKIIYKGNGKEIREYIHVKDAAKLSALVVSKKLKNNVISIFGQKSITVDQLFNLMFEIYGKKKRVKYLNSINADDHYGFSPYRFVPENSIKLTSNMSTDLGEGILRLFNLNDKKK